MYTQIKVFIFQMNFLLLIRIFSSITSPIIIWFLDKIKDSVTSEEELEILLNRIEEK